MARLEFLEKETIEVIDTLAWIIAGEKRIEVQLLVTNQRFLAIKETQDNETKIVCSFNLGELDHVKQLEKASTCYTCYLKENRFVVFDSDPIGTYLKKLC